MKGRPALSLSANLKAAIRNLAKYVISLIIYVFTLAKDHLFAKSKVVASNSPKMAISQSTCDCTQARDLISVKFVI